MLSSFSNSVRNCAYRNKIFRGNKEDGQPDWNKLRRLPVRHIRLFFFNFWKSIFNLFVVRFNYPIAVTLSLHPSVPYCRGVQGVSEVALNNWSPMMPKLTSLSNVCTPDRGHFSSLDAGIVIVFFCFPLFFKLFFLFFPFLFRYVFSYFPIFFF